MVRNKGIVGIGFCDFAGGRPRALVRYRNQHYAARGAGTQSAPRVHRQRKDEFKPKPSRHNPVNSGATVGGTAGVITSGFVVGNTPTLEGR